MAAKIKEGIILYDIELNGCLNGVYTNEDLLVDGIIFNEINRKKESQGEDSPINGVYDCFYFDLQNERVDATLTISPKGSLHNTFSFSWIKVGETAPVFIGVGYKMNQRQIVVHYQSA